MPTGKKRNAAANFRGGELQVYPLADPDAPVVDTQGNWISLSHLERGDLFDDNPMDKIYKETGGLLKALPQNRDVYINGIFLQSDGDLLTFLADTCRDQFYAVYRDNGIVNAKHQEFFFAVCQIKPGFQLSDAIKKPPFEIYVLENDAALTIATAALPTVAHTSTDAVIAAKKYYKLVETAVA